MVRLSIKQSGCAGFGYVLDLVKAPDVRDLVFEREGAHLYVPLKVMPFIDGTELDYVRLRFETRFSNLIIPKRSTSAICSESFRIE
ncbi:MAG: iron-sulfur cluster biosynthesis family protein [Symbiopectobacterium sp.]